MRAFDHKVRSRGYSHVVGVDEAGRGPLAGPVIAGACFLPPDLVVPYLNDSKKLTPARRGQLFSFLTSHPEVSYGVGIVSPNKIDEINILQATIVAMRQAVDSLKRKPDFVLVDGLSLPHPIPSEKVIKGDCLSLLIAAASIIAKETRDRLMCQYDEQFPEYGFAKHKGYGTKQHLAAIATHGPCPIHRLTFAPLKH